MYKKRLIILSIILIVLSTIAYSGLATSLAITGEANIRAVSDIRVTDISLDNVENGAVEQYKSKYTKKGVTTGFKLPNTNSSISYKIEITNKGDMDEAIYELSTVSNNTGLKILIDGEEVNNKLPIIVPYRTKKVITITYTTTSPSNETINVVNTFTFKHVYYITYETNGGTTIERQIKYEDVDINITSEIPTKSGYVFIGWTDEQNGETVKYSPGDQYTLNSNKVLYAIYDSSFNITYKVKHYKHNLGDSYYTLNSTDTISAEKDSEVSLSTLKKNLTGYTYENGFDYDGGTTKPSSGSVETTIIDDSSKVISLYYRPNYLYIQYDMNGGSLASSHSSEISNIDSLLTYTENTTPTNFLSGFYGSIVGSADLNDYSVSNTGLNNYNNDTFINLERAGYKVTSKKEWNTKADGTGTTYDQGSNLELSANSLASSAGMDLSAGDVVMKLYVNWIPRTYTLNFDKNGGIINTAKLSTVDVASEIIDGTINGAVLENDYLYFNGTDSSYVNLGIINRKYMTLEATFSTTYMNRTSNQTIIGNLEQGGGWIFLKGDYKISGGFYISGSYRYITTSYSIESGKKYHAVLTYDGIIEKLFVNGELIGIYSIESTIESSINNTIMALGVNPYKSAGNGECFKGNIYSAAVYTNSKNSKTVTYQSQYGTLPVPTREGYTFDGWYYDDNKISETSIYNVPSDSSVEAKYIPNTYNIIFDKNKENATGSMSNQVVTYDEPTKINANTYLHTDYSFNGWNTKADGSGISYTDEEEILNLKTSGEITLYAQWIEKVFVNVTFNANEGEVSPSNKTVVYNSMYGDLPEPTKRGYKFMGWSTLPTEYQEVEYIVSTGTQYIDTKYPLWKDKNWKIEYKFDVSEFYNYNNMFGALATTNSNNEIWIASDKNYYVRVGGISKTSIATLSLKTPYTIIHDNTGSNLLNYVNGTLTKTLSRANTSFNYDLGFGHRSGGQYLKGKIYYLKFWSNGELVRDMVPCYRKSDNEIGLYDMVNGVFYPNAGTGVFTEGSDVNNTVTSSTKVITNEDHTLYATWIRHGWDFENEDDFDETGEPLIDQKWAYYDNGTRIMDGWIYTYGNYYDDSGVKHYYYMKDGYAYLGWLKDNGNWYFLTWYDKNHNGFVEGHRISGQTYEIDGVEYEFDEDGICQNPPSDLE